jgi:hypothetical protein
MFLIELLTISLKQIRTNYRFSSNTGQISQLYDNTALIFVTVG